MRRLITISAFLLLANGPEAESQTARCHLAPRPYGFGGTCRPEQPLPGVGQSPRLRLPDSVRVWTTAGPQDPPPWRGNLSLPGGEVAFEIAAAASASGPGRLVLRTGIMWLPVQEWRQLDSSRTPCASCDRTAKHLLLVLDLVNAPPATDDDTAILRSALAGLDEIESWNREEAQSCGRTTDLTNTGLFCMLYTAVEARMGRYHHRQPAVELVRAVIFERWRDRITSHTLVDFNNHPATTTADIRAVLQVALERAASQAQDQRE